MEVNFSMWIYWNMWQLVAEVCLCRDLATACFIQLESADCRSLFLTFLKAKAIINLGYPWNALYDFTSTTEHQNSSQDHLSTVSLKQLTFGQDIQK